MRIALISDLHLGSEIGSAQMRRVVEEVNACEADIVVIAGDVFNAEVEDCCDLDETAAELRHKKAVWAYTPYSAITTRRPNIRRCKRFLNLPASAC